MSSKIGNIVLINALTYISSSFLQVVYEIKNSILFEYVHVIDVITTRLSSLV